MKLINLLVYMLLINVIAFLATVADKNFAKKKKRRISEKSLFVIALFGGALGMFVAMKSVRHKTRHKSFMIGLPCIFILQVAFLFAVSYYGFLY